MGSPQKSIRVSCLLVRSIDIGYVCVCELGLSMTEESTPFPLKAVCFRLNMQLKPLRYASPSRSLSLFFYFYESVREQKGLQLWEVFHCFWRICMENCNFSATFSFFGIKCWYLCWYFCVYKWVSIVLQLGSTAIGLKTKEGVVLAVEKRITSPLLVWFCSIYVICNYISGVL